MHDGSFLGGCAGLHPAPPSFKPKPVKGTSASAPPLPSQLVKFKRSIEQESVSLSKMKQLFRKANDQARAQGLPSPSSRSVHPLGTPAAAAAAAAHSSAHRASPKDGVWKSRTYLSVSMCENNARSLTRSLAFSPSLSVLSPQGETLEDIVKRNQAVHSNNRLITKVEGSGVLYGGGTGSNSRKGISKLEQLVIARIAGIVGFDTIRKSSLDILTDLLERVIAVSRYHSVSLSVSLDISMYLCITVYHCSLSLSLSFASLLLSEAGRGCALRQGCLLCRTVSARARDGGHERHLLFGHCPCG